MEVIVRQLRQKIKVIQVRFVKKKSVHTPARIVACRVITGRGPARTLCSLPTGALGLNVDFIVAVIRLHVELVAAIKKSKIRMGNVCCEPVRPTVVLDCSNYCRI